MLFLLQFGLNYVPKVRQQLRMQYAHVEKNGQFDLCKVFFLHRHGLLKYILTNIFSSTTYKSHTVCPGSSDPPEKIFNVFAS